MFNVVKKSQLQQKIELNFWSHLTANYAKFHGYGKYRGYNQQDFVIPESNIKPVPSLLIKPEG